VRIPPQERKVDARDGEELRRHQPDEIRSGRGQELWRLREGGLRARGAADAVPLFEDGDREPALGEEQGRAEPVVARADDDDVRHARHHARVLPAQQARLPWKSVTGSAYWIAPMVNGPVAGRGAPFLSYGTSA